MNEPTREMILAEPAGKRMDAWIGIYVMGLQSIKLGIDSVCPYCGDDMQYTRGRARCSTCREWRYSPYKEYSANIADALEAVEKMRPLKLILFENMNEEYHNYYAYIGPGHELGNEPWIAGGPIELAICRAALLATLEGK